MPLNIIPTATAYMALPAILWPPPLQRGLLALAVCFLVAVGIGLVLVLLDEIWRDGDSS